MPGIRYIRIASKFWQDEKIKELSDGGKLLYLYILTAPHSNMIGYYVLPKPYIAYDLRWSDEQLHKRFDELLRNGLIKYCEQSDVVLVPNYLKYNTIQNANQAKGAVTRLSALPANALVDEFETVVKRFAERFANELTEGLPKRYGNTVSVTETVTETVTEDSGEQVRTEKEKTVANKFDDNSIPMRLAQHLKTEILNQDPDTKVPDNLQPWALTADRMIRIDKRDPQEAANLITWAQHNDFWQANILSMKKFRKQYDKLKRQAQSAVRSRSNQSGETAAQRMLREALEEEQADIININ